MVFVDGPTVRRLVPMRDAIAAVREAFIEASLGRSEQPPRLALDSGRALVMAASMTSFSGTVVKVVTVRPENRARGLSAIHAVVLWMEGESGRPVACLDGEAVTALRTGAASGLATDILAPPEAAHLAIIGSGAQALDQVMAIAAVRPLSRVAIYGRQRDGAKRLEGEVARRLPVEVVLADSIRSAVAAADIVCCATSAESPLFDSEDLTTDVHVNAIGSFRPSMRELPRALLNSAATVAVDSRAAALKESGEVIDAVSNGFPPERLVEIGYLAANGYRRPPGHSVFKSVGVGVQDWAIAKLVVELVMATEAGSSLSSPKPV